MNTGALLPDEGSGYFTNNGSCTSGRPLKCSWRAGCGEIRKSGSEGSGEETTCRKAGSAPCRRPCVSTWFRGLRSLLPQARPRSVANGAG